MNKSLWASLLLALGTGTALADSVRVPPHPTYQAECASCHVAYPPQLLPSSSWRQLMARLERHFGSDASLEPPMRAEIERYLVAHAGRTAAPAGEEPRITGTRWFRKEHDDEVPAGRNMADCAACHAGANQGYFDDD